MKNLSWCVVAVALAGCGVSDAELSSSDESATTGDELSAASNSFVAVRRDLRRCMAPLCGGYWVHDLNRVALTERYVSGFDFGTSKLDDGAQAQVYEAGGDLVLRGKLGPIDPRFNTRAFLVAEAWRGMPGVTPAAGELFYSVTDLDVRCFAAPCPSLTAKKLNATTTTTAHGLSVERSSLQRVDQGWLSSRVRLHGALVAARFTAGQQLPGGLEKVLDASQVFVKLPERVGPCPMFPIAQCPSGKIRTMARTADRCLVPAACVTPGMCARPNASCAPDYTLQSWSGGSAGCPVLACDPTFATQ